MGFSVSEIGKRGKYRFVAVLFPLAFLVAMATFTGGGAIAEDGGGPTPPPTGDWMIDEDTMIEGADLNVTGDIVVGRAIEMIIKDSVLRLNSTGEHRSALRVEAGGTLIVVNSTIRTYAFEAHIQSSISLSDGSFITTRGNCLLRSESLHLEDVTIDNRARDGEVDEDGGDAVMVLSGESGTVFANVTVRNVGGNAGKTSPGNDGSMGGNSILISNASRWSGCVIECRAGMSQGGGFRIANGSGGDGGSGAFARVQLTATSLEGTTIHVEGSDGGPGSRGVDNEAGDAGDAGNGARGGDADLSIRGETAIELVDCELTAIAGNGGSGGSGGWATEGDGGDGGLGSPAGHSTITIGTNGDILMVRTVFEACGGEGGYGGDYGRLESGVGKQGAPAPGGDGGYGSVVIHGPGDLVAQGMTVEARGGHGLDGGGGYDQGDLGGDGGDGLIDIYVPVNLTGDVVDLRATGGNGGPGGPAFSDIRGNGGDGGDANIVLTSLIQMDVEAPSVYSTPGTGGLGNKPIYDGEPGRAGLDVRPLMLFLRNGTLNRPLDDLGGDSRAYLLNMVFDMDFGIHVLPKEEAIAWERYAVTVILLDRVDQGKAGPLVGWTVSVFVADTGQFVAEAVSDDQGRCFFNLSAFEYTSSSVDYIEYHFIALSPDGRTSKKVRTGVRPFSIVHIAIPPPCPGPFIVIEAPEEGREYALQPSRGDELETNGHFVCERTVRGMTVRLHPGDPAPDDWPVHQLRQSPIPYENLTDKDTRWGWFFPPDELSNRWRFFYSFPMTNDGVEYLEGEWVLDVSVSTSEGTRNSSVGFELLFEEDTERPWVLVGPGMDGEVREGSLLTIHGTAGDEHQLLAVQVRVDAGPWEVLTSSEDWSYVLDTDDLDQGPHTLDFRAWDGLQYSEISSASFMVLASEDAGGGEGDGGIEWTPRLYLMAGAVVLAVAALALLLVILVLRHRSSPDS